MNKSAKYDILHICVLWFYIMSKLSLSHVKFYSAKYAIAPNILYGKCNKNKLFHKWLRVYCCSYVGDGSSIALPTHFFMILVKCKNPSHTLPCGDDFDVMSFILPHVDTMPNCLVSRRFLLLYLIYDIILNSVYSYMYFFMYI